MDQLNEKHIAFLILGTTIVSLKTYPKVFTINGLRDSWVAMIIASILILLFFIFVIQTCIRKNTFNIVEIYQQALGKPLGNFFIALFALGLVLTLMESASVEANSMHTNMLADTPVWFFILFFVVPAIYTIKQDLVGIIITTSIGLVLIIIAGFTLAFLTNQYKHYEYLFPIFPHGITKGFILSVLQILGLYGHVAIILPYLSKLGSKKRLFSSTLLSLLFVIQMEIFSIIGVMATFHIERLNSMSYPKLLQTQLVSRFQFLEAGELFVMIEMIGGWYIKYILTFYALIRILKDYGIDKQWMIYLISVLIGIGAYFVGNNLLRLFQFLNYFTYFSLANFVVIPLIVFTIFSLRTQPKASTNMQ